MAICIFRILTYVGQGLDLAVGNRPVIVAQSTQHEQDYRNGNGVKKKSEVNAVGVGNLLHLRTYPYKGAHRSDDLSHWLVYNDEPQASASPSVASSWSPANMLIDDSFKEPKELQTVFFALSPAMVNILHPDLVTSLVQATAPLIYDDVNVVGQYRRLIKPGVEFKHTRKASYNGGPPILVCETDDERGEKDHGNVRNEKAHHGERSSYDDPDLDQKATDDAVGSKSDLTFKCTETGKVLQNGELPKNFPYNANKHVQKRNQITVGRRSVHLQGESTGYQAETLPVSSSGGASIASQFMLRSTRGNRQYDVPQVECPISEDGMERFACPTADRMGRYRCIDDHVLCDGFIDCPTGEDEDRQACMFYKTTKAHLDVLADAILRWARGR